MKKTLYILTLFFMCFFINFDKVGAEEINKGDWLYTCNYKSSDGQVIVDYFVYRQGQSFSENSKNIRLTKWYDMNSDDLPSDLLYEGPVDEQKTILKNACPSHYLVEKTSKKKFKIKGYAYSSETAEEVKANNDGNGILVVLQNDYVSMLKAIRRASTTTVKAFYHAAYNGDYINALKCIDSEDPPCAFPEKTYTCTYNISKEKTYDMTFNNLFAYTATKYQELGYNQVPFKDGYYVDYFGYCPTEVYQINYNGETVFTYGITTWPYVCEKSDYKCFKYTYGHEAREAYGKKTTAVKDVNPSPKAQYYLDGVFEDKSDKIVDVEINGKTDGTVTNYTLTVEGSKAYFIINEKQDLGTFNKILSSSSSFPIYLLCDKHLANDEMLLKVDSTTGVVTANKNNKAPDDFEGYYCEFKAVKGTTLKRTYIKHTDSNAPEFSSDSLLAGLINSEIEKVKNGGFDKDELFKSTKSIYNQCKRKLGNINIKESDEIYKLCTDFMEKKVPDWASKGYFGNNVVIGGSGSTDCATTLGSLTEWLKKIYNVVLLAVPVIIVILGFKDFIKALVNGKEDELKKSGSTFIKRLIFGAVFVALPVLISFVIGLALGDGFADICIM